ncbi:hypothetical protein CSB93_1479 [Pseudomonas paraeruginosa]|uniref:Uncharacterized protein n=1 Tax=Pseudomonas paraeruginosa TaxID=2994495 RepID=A0A2R3IRG8_9PSED|nr:hypothetical protein CSB93_1479 [Pseudomonas paraeruginosa]
MCSGMSEFPCCSCMGSQAARARNTLGREGGARNPVID